MLKIMLVNTIKSSYFQHPKSHINILKDKRYEYNNENNADSISGIKNKRYNLEHNEIIFFFILFNKNMTPDIHLIIE
jgi:hypothetical protein